MAVQNGDGTSLAREGAEAIARICDAARRIGHPGPYRVVESINTILRESHTLSDLLRTADEAALIDAVIELMRRERGVTHVPRQSISPLVQWATSPSEAAVADAIADVVRAAHSLDLLHGADTSILLICDAAHHLHEQAATTDNEFLLAVRAAELFQDRGGLAGVFRGGRWNA